MSLVPSLVDGWRCRWCNLVKSWDFPLPIISHFTDVVFHRSFQKLQKQVHFWVQTHFPIILKNHQVIHHSSLFVGSIPIIHDIPLHPHKFWWYPTKPSNQLYTVNHIIPDHIPIIIYIYHNIYIYILNPHYIIYIPIYPYISLYIPIRPPLHRKHPNGIPTWMCIFHESDPCPKIIRSVCGSSFISNWFYSPFTMAEKLGRPSKTENPQGKPGPPGLTPQLPCP